MRLDSIMLYSSLFYLFKKEKPIEPIFKLRDQSHWRDTCRDVEEREFQGQGQTEKRLSHSGP